MSMHKRIQAGYYKTKKPYSKAKVKAIDARRLREEYRIDESRLTELFWSDLADELGISKGDPFFSEFRRMCWDQGHSGGLSEVYIIATEYSGLIDMYLEAHATHWFREKVKGGK